MSILESNIPSPLLVPKGFSYGCAAAAIKTAGRLDVGMIVSHSPATTAGVFTQNKFSAAPVIFCRNLLKDSPTTQGVIVNAGCANAATGDVGFDNAKEMSSLSRAVLAMATAPMMVSSTGTIGVQLPMDRLENGINQCAVNLKDRPEGFIDFARSIMTTDTVPKIATATISTPEGDIVISGCAKGSGMIHPKMATMLSYIVTDAIISSTALDSIFRDVIGRTLNCVTVDGDTSTNDTALIFANGASRIDVIASEDLQYEFEKALEEVLTQLARLLARDGEGATHLVEVHVEGAKSFQDARTAALAIANSPLVKTAIYGKDANWGRIACALGNSGVDFDSNVVDIYLGQMQLMSQGEPVPFSEEQALEILAEETVKIRVALNLSDGNATAYTCDFTEKYIEINGAYRT